MKTNISVLISLAIIFIGFMFTCHPAHRQEEPGKPQEETREMEQQRIERTAKISRITDKICAICTLTSRLPKDSDEYYFQQLIEMGIYSLGDYPLDTTLAQLSALEAHIKSLVIQYGDTTSY